MGIALLAFAAFHLAWRVEPALRYQLLAPPFFTDTAFLTRFLREPGGLLSYGAAALGQHNAVNAPGAVTFTLLLASLLAAARQVVAAATGRSGAVPTCLLVALLAALPGRFDGDPERVALGLLAAVLAACAWLPARALPPAAPIALGWLLSGLLFGVAGAPSALLFGLVVWLAEIFAKRPLSGLLPGLSGFLLGPLWNWWHPAFHALAPTSQWGVGFTLALTVAAFLLLPLWLGLHLALDRFPCWRPSASWQGRAWVAGGIAAMALIAASVDPTRQTLARLDAAAARSHWDAVVAAARRLPALPPRARIEVARALFHQGVLLRDLFEFPQLPGWDLLPDLKAGLDTGGAQARTLLELGQVNLAEHVAHEFFEINGSRPGTLRLLADINLLKDRPEAARIFLNRLALTPCERHQARVALDSLSGDPRHAGRPDLAAIRPLLPRTDEPDSALPTEALLRQLLASNPTNRMAFEYLLAQHLLAGRLEAVAADVAGLDAFGKSAELPPLCEEALLLYRGQTGQPLDLHGRTIRPATQDRYRRFGEIAQRHSNDRTRAFAALAPEFGGTYWFFRTFGVSAPSR